MPGSELSPSANFMAFTVVSRALRFALIQLYECCLFFDPDQVPGAVMSLTSARSDFCRILVAAHFILGRGLASVIRDTVPTALILEVASFHEAMAQLNSEDFLVAIFQADLGDFESSIDFQTLHARHPRLILGIVSNRDDPRVILSYLAAGVSVYVVEKAGQPEIGRAIEALLARTIYVPPSVMLAAELPSRESPARGPHRDERGLTARQREVLRLLLDGYSNKEIARALNLSPHTVKIHVSALLRHFAVQKRTDLQTARGSHKTGRLHAVLPSLVATSRVNLALDG